MSRATLVMGVVTLSSLGVGGLISATNPLTALAARLQGCEPTGSCTHVIYVRSADMPLSEDALPNLIEAVRALRVPHTVLSADALFESTRDSTTEALRTALIRAGATLHFPSVIVMRGTLPVGKAFVGYKSTATYEGMLMRRLGVLEAVSPTADATRGMPWRQVRLLATYHLDERPGAFFRRVPGTRYISFDMGGTVHLHHLESGERFLAPGQLDFVPSPDGRLFVTPGPGGLEFYAVSEVLRSGAQGDARALRPIFVDETLRDAYPSVGVLNSEPSENRVRYRVLTAWQNQAQYRDFDVVFSGSGVTASVRGLGARVTACQDVELSLPMLSKNGRELSARDERTGTTKVFRLGSPGECREIFDTGMQTTKATFSNNGALLAFGSHGESQSDLSVYVLDRRTHIATRVPFSASASLTIPEFVGPDSLLILVAGKGSGAPSEFRLVCCLR